MKNLLIILLFSLAACGAEEQKTYKTAYPDANWHWEKMQQQLAEANKSPLISCYEKILQSQKGKDAFYKCFENYDTLNKPKNIANYNTKIYTNSANIYGCYNSLLINTIAYENNYYLYPNIDAGDRVFEAYSDITAKDSQALFNHKLIEIGIGLVFPKEIENQLSIDSDFNNQYQLDTTFPLINTQLYLEARNKKGYIFELGTNGGIREVNRFLRDNKNFYTPKNIAKIDSFLLILQTAEGLNTYTQVPLIDFAKKSVDSVKLKIKGFDYYKQAIYYLDSLVAHTCELPNGIVLPDPRMYSHYEYSIDNLVVMREYLSQNTPTLLHYKNKANNSSPWQNYFLAYHIAYEKDGCPQITKFDMIIPQRMYYFICFPDGWCNDYGGGASYLHLIRQK